MNFSLIYMTAGSQDEATRIGKTLVEERLVACVNLIPGMRSLYWWDGAIQEGSEVVVIAKTRTERVSAVVDRVKSIHSYDCPCVLALPIESGNPGFLDWIRRETLEPGPEKPAE